MGGRGASSGNAKSSNSAKKHFPSKAELRSRLTKKDLEELEKRYKSAIKLNESKGHKLDDSTRKEIKKQLADNIAKKYITKEEKAIRKEINEKRLSKFAKSQSAVKAWDWAAEKVGLTTKLTNKEKERFVNEMSKEMWPGSSIYSQAMKAVKLHQKLFGRGGRS